jgi:hypothetical protein
MRAQTVRRFALTELMFSDRCRLLTDDLSTETMTDDGDVAGVIWWAAPESARCKARQRAAHVREVFTGYRFGCAEAALSGEPHPQYQPTLPKQKRLAAKAKEFNAGVRTVERWVKLYLQGGEAVLISGKAVQPGLGCRGFESFGQTALEIMIEHTDMSRPSKTFVINHAPCVSATLGSKPWPAPSVSPCASSPASPTGAFAP